MSKNLNNLQKKEPHTQLPVKLEEIVSSILKDTTPEMKNSFCNMLKELFILTLEMPAGSTIPGWKAWAPMPRKYTARHSRRKSNGQR